MQEMLEGRMSPIASAETKQFDRQVLLGCMAFIMTAAACHLMFLVGLGVGKL